MARPTILSEEEDMEEEQEKEEEEEEDPRPNKKGVFNNRTLTRNPGTLDADSGTLSATPGQAPPDVVVTYRKGELVFTIGKTVTLWAPAPCMDGFRMDLLMRALERDQIYVIRTTAQVTAYISAKGDMARYAWSFGDHTPCGSAIMLPTASLLATLCGLEVRENLLCPKKAGALLPSHPSSQNATPGTPASSSSGTKPSAGWCELPPQWLQYGIDPEMTCFPLR